MLYWARRHSSRYHRSDLSKERQAMRDFGSLPFHLRVVSLLGLLCLLAFSLLFSNLLFVTILSSLSPDSWRILLMAVNLLILGWTCLTVVRIYRARMAQSDGGPFPVSSWQRQGRALVLWAALPPRGRALAVFIPPAPLPFGPLLPVPIA